MDQAPDAHPKLTQLYDGLLSGKRGDLAKAISAVESDSALGRGLLERIREPSGERLGKTIVIGITGSPGCGKSTLTNALLGDLRSRDKRLGVIAVDPSSPVSGGALLGDRLRMAQHAVDPDVFVRSLSSRGRLGGLAPAARAIVDVMDAAGMDIVLVETVGTGQSEVEIIALADVNIVVSAPGLGDDIQAIKSGILEIADILVVNKGDLPGAEQTASQLRSMLSLRAASGRGVPVLVTSALENSGITALTEHILEQGEAQRGRGRRPLTLTGLRRALEGEIIRRLGEAVEARGPELEETLCRSVLDGRCTIEAAAEEFIRTFVRDPSLLQRKH